MVEITAYASGTFCFIEAGSPNIGVARDFYTALFGWQAEERPIPDGGMYVRFLKRGKPVAGMYPLGAEQPAVGIPSHWMSYVSVENAAAALEVAVGAGATPCGGVIDVPGVVAVAEFTDPTGAVCGLWQSQGHIGAVHVNEPGTLIWNELLTDDPQAAVAFYCSVFNWTHEVHGMPAGPRHLFKDGDALRGGMMPINPEMGDVSPSWRAYIAVGDLDDSLAKVVALGGSVGSNVVDVSGMGRVAEVRDPAGVNFMLMEPARQH